MGERRKDWKSAVDPRTGKTYWYHRKTRETTWIRPTFFEDDDKHLISFLPVREEALNLKELRQLHLNLRKLNSHDSNSEFDRNLINSLCAYSISGIAEVSLNWALYLLCCLSSRKSFGENFDLDTELFTNLFDCAVSFGFTAQVLLFQICFNMHNNSFQFADYVMEEHLSKFQKVLATQSFPYQSFSLEILENILKECDFQFLTKLGCCGEHVSATLLLIYARISCRYMKSTSILLFQHSIGKNFSNLQLLVRYSHPFTP
jgi:hypothetical protein